MKPAVEVSVVMAVHDDEDHLAESLASILDQEGVELECIVVDDGSTDGSPGILDDFAARDSRVRVLRQANAGLTVALVRGCTEAQGEFVARQDSDDVSLPGRLAEQVALLRSAPDAVLATSDVVDFVDAETELLTHGPGEVEIELSDGAVDRMPGVPAHGSVLMRRHALDECGGYRPEFYFAQDSDLWLRLAALGRFVSVARTLYRRRVPAGSISSTRSRAQARFAELAVQAHVLRRAGASDGEVVEEAARFRADCLAARAPAGRAARADARCSVALQAERRDPGLALRTYLEAIALNPICLRAWRRLPFCVARLL